MSAIKHFVNIYVWIGVIYMFMQVFSFFTINLIWLEFFDANTALWCIGISFFWTISAAIIDDLGLYHRWFPE